MPASKFELHRVNLHILSPIHIGTGQELDPFSYVIRGNSLLIIDLIKWMEDYPEQEKLYNMMDSDNFAEIRTFIADNIDSESVTLGSIPVTSNGLLSTYDRVIKAKDRRNQLLIDGMTRNDISQTAYIPGSSIKGSVRTAIANHFVETAGVTSRNMKKTYKPAFEPDYNEKIFGKINEDPMRNLKLSDVPLEGFGSIIVEAEEYSLNEEKSKTPKGYKEVSANLCQNGEDVVYPLRLSLKPFSLHNDKVDVHFILEALFRFYVSKYKQEYSKFYSKSGAEEIRQETAPMCLKVINLKTNETLIRIGHFSHVECITLDDVREPQTRMVKGKRMPYGTTRTLANGLYPFGWAKLEFLDLESKPREGNDWPFSIQELERIAKAKGEAAKKSKVAAETAEVRRREEEAKRIAEEKRKAELEAMSPEERDIALIRDRGLIANQVISIFNRIDEFSKENKPALAWAMKEYWMENKKWEGKLSKKQKKKVQKIKEILGEG